MPAGGAHPLATVTSVATTQRWTVEQVAAVAPNPRSVADAEPHATESRWA